MSHLRPDTKNYCCSSLPWFLAFIRHALNYHEKWCLPGLCIKRLNQLWTGHGLFWHMRHPGTDLGHLFFAAIHSRFLLFMRAGIKTCVPCTVREKIRINYTDIKEFNSFFHFTVPGVKTFETLCKCEVLSNNYYKICRVHSYYLRVLVLKWYKMVSTFLKYYINILTPFFFFFFTLEEPVFQFSLEYLDLIGRSEHLMHIYICIMITKLDIWPLQLICFWIVFCTIMDYYGELLLVKYLI